MKFDKYEWTIIILGVLIFLTTCISPPGLMDDVDAVQAQIARTMLESGDWVTAKLNGIAYLEKPPMKYWLIASFFAIFGVHDSVARLPIALGIVGMCWAVFRFALWITNSKTAAFYSGLALVSCIGLFLFTRILIADVLITLTITTALWSFLGIVDEDEKSSNYWVITGAISIALGILLKGLIAIIFPLGASCLYLILTKQIFQKQTWKKINLPLFIFVILLIALPWHIIATLRNPPYFDFSMTSEAGKYRGFFWFYFFNEHILRFLGRRYPRDYNTVPIIAFWLLNLVWLFPSSAFLPSVKSLHFTINPQNRLERFSLLALSWITVVMLFFSFSTRQEYYSMPIYPALALLIGIALSKRSDLPKLGRWLITSIFTLSAIAILAILYLVRNVVTKGDISNALAKSTDVYAVYTLSLGHFGDLSLNSFAYLRFPLVLALLSTFIGVVAMYWAKKNRDIAYSLLAITMMIFFQAANQALIVFEPYLGSRPLAETLKTVPAGKLVVDNQYYAFSSVFFYDNPKEALLLNGRITNLAYGSYAPNAPNVFINDQEFKELWQKAERVYLLVEKPSFGRLQKLIGEENFYIIRESGGKLLLTNQKL